MTDYKLVPVELIERAAIALERFANDTLAGRNSAHELRELLAAASAVQGEPVAWMHDSPGRVDVIHAEVKKLLVDSHDTAGHLHRPLDKSEHYTIPLYATPQPAEQQPAPDVAGLVEALESLLRHAKKMGRTSALYDKARAALADYRKGGEV